ncbi:polygalacturonase-like protein [Tanacetum coccineum]
MGGFSFKNLTFALLVAAIVSFSTTDICNARRGKYWRHSTGGAFGSMYEKKGKNHGEDQHQVDKPHSQEGSEYNVLKYGAKGDGKSDDTKAFQAAWVDACKVEASTIIVPSDYKFLVGATSFSGSDCKKNIIFQIDGTILAPTDSKAWGSGLDHWLEFTEVVGFTITGKGNLDGRGSAWWTQSIYGSSNNEELVLLDNTTKSEDLQVSTSVYTKIPGTKPMALKIVGGSDVTVTGITIQNSPLFHLTFDNCDGVLVYDISISSPGDSPNTDGIHLTSSKNVIIHHTTLACGDDCISIQTGCKNVLIHDVNCGPGHGISIGSLGIDGKTACVSNITVKDVKIHDTMTGVRIKTWQGAAGLVRGVLFSNVQISEVEVPIMIDQYYCDHTTCKNQSSAVSIANIAYENIRGTYTIQPVHLSCSDSKPCTDLRLTNIELNPKPNGHQLLKPFCWNAYGKLNAPIVPEIDCLQGESSNNLDLDDAICDSGDNKKMYWIKWENILASHDKGGLGIGSLKAFNLALLQKWRWRLVTISDSLWARVVKAIHGVDTGMELKGYNSFGTCANIVDSFSMLHSKDIIPLHTLRHKVGNGSSIRFWKDNWIGNGPLSTRYNQLFHLDANPNCMLADRVSDDTWTWNWKRQRLGSRNRESLEILKMEIGHVQVNDRPDS